MACGGPDFAAVVQHLVALAAQHLPGPVARERPARRPAGDGRWCRAEILAPADPSLNPTTTTIKQPGEARAGAHVPTEFFLGT